jgi:predicted permease
MLPSKKSMNHTITITRRIAVAAAIVISTLVAGASLSILQQPVYANAESLSQFGDPSATTHSMASANLTPLVMPMGITVTPRCPADTVFDVITQASLPPGYNTLPVGTVLCMQKIGHQTITTITPAGTTLKMQVIASDPNQSTCSSPSVLGLVSVGIPPIPGTTSLCVSLL